MCLPATHKTEETLSPLFLPDGSINADDSYISVVIPKDIIRHIDNPFLNCDLNSEHAILNMQDMKQ